MVGVLPKIDSPDGALLEDFRLSLWKPFQDNYEDKWDQGMCSVVQDVPDIILNLNFYS